MDQQLGAEAFCVYDEAARAIWSQTDDFTNDAIARDFDGCETSWFGEGAGRSRRHQERARGRCAAQEVASAKPGTRVATEAGRSEERRVGKECRWRWWADQ